ncbi:MAG: bifunctional 4-hydroxy-2-oxoglutarate aldolase/2-dehydro-3-deoxy-phosphogluconate aldolase [Pyrinomonadaceae bacterium]
MDKAEVLRRIIETGVLPVIRAASVSEARGAIDAIFAGGISTFEVTMTVPGAIGLIAELSTIEGLLIGAGTVLEPETARECIAAGARFIVSPSTNFDTIAYCAEAETIVMPGALTPTEIVNAWDAGADFVKVFPAGSMGGAAYLSSLKAPLPQIRMIPTGGVSLATVKDLIRAGAEAVGVGADLVDLKALRKGNSGAITETAREYVRLVDEARNQIS